MKRLSSIFMALLFLALSQAMGQEHISSPNGTSGSGQLLSSADENAVLQAIIDEMYLNNLQGDGFDVGKQTSGSAYELKAYFKPALNSNGAGWVIYKLMPYGEVLRMFSFRSDGIAVLYGKLRDRFPPTQPSYLTVYMDDDELCQLKKDWLKKDFTVELKPGTERIAEALKRQQKRE